MELSKVSREPEIIRGEPDDGTPFILGLSSAGILSGMYRIVEVHADTRPAWMLVQDREGRQYRVSVARFG